MGVIGGQITGGDVGLADSVTDGQTANLTTDKAIPIACYDPTTGKWQLKRCDVSTGGTNYIASADSVSTPGTTQTLIDFTVATAKVRTLTKCVVTCHHYAAFEIKRNSVIIGSGRTNPAVPNAVFNWLPNEVAVATDQIEVFFTALSDTPASDVEAYVFGVEKSI